MLLATASGDKALASAATPGSLSPFSYLRSDTLTGRDVTPESARALSVVYACQRFIALGVGTMPLQTMRDDGVVQERAQLGTLSSVLEDSPNEDMSAEHFWSCMLTHVASRGNAYAAKIFDKQGRLVSLYPIHAATMSAFRDAEGRKWFRWTGDSANAGSVDYFTPRQILHIPYLSFDTALMGHSPIAVERQRIAVGAAQSEYQQRFFKQNGVPKAAITLPGKLTAERMQEFKNQWEAANSGPENFHRMSVLPSGASIANVGISMEDAQFVEQMQYTDLEVARIYGLPATSLDLATPYSLTYQTTTQNDLRAVKWGLGPWAVMVEAALRADADLFRGSGYSARFNFDALLRADIKTRSEIGRNWLKSGVKNPNELRQLENLPPREGGEDYLLGADIQSQNKAQAEADVLLDQIDAGSGGDDDESVEDES